MWRWLEWIAVTIAGFAVAVGAIVILSGGLAGGRDDPGLSLRTGQTVSGTAYRDQGDAHLTPGSPHPVYDSSPPSSGPHVPVAVRREGTAISDDELLQALSVGDVVFLYSGARPPAGLGEVADRVAPRFTPALAAAGQTVILARRAGLQQITAVAWTHVLRSDDADALQAFAQHWIGRGAGARATSVAGTG